MAVQKNEFFETENKKIMAIHKKYSAKDKDGKVHCCDCPYGLKNYYHCDCLFSNQINKKEGEE